LAEPLISEPLLSYAGRDLEVMAGAANYRRWIVDTFGAELGRDVLEVGAGQGQLTGMLLDPAGGRRITALEPSMEMFPLLDARFTGGEPVSRRQARLPDVADDLVARFDTVVYANVLEHIRDDAAELEAAWRVLQPGGTLCVFVPALPALFGRFDAEIGHFRRYRGKGLEALVRGAGFEIVRVFHFDLLGALAWFVLCRVLRRAPTPAQVAWFDLRIVPVMRRVEGRWPPLIGKNLVCVGRKRG
jgi:SAM-dependent methyltransferase